MTIGVGLKIVASILPGLLLLQGDSCSSQPTGGAAQTSVNRNAASTTTATPRGAADRSTDTSNMNNQNQGSSRAQLASGMWGGKDIRIHVADESTQVELSCGHGTITEPLRLGSDGRFEAAGTYTAEGPGPVREDAVNNIPARYGGEVEGKVMTLTITLADSNRKVGTFTLEQGKGVRLVKCL